MSAAAPAPLQPGIYVVDGEAVGSLAPKFRGMSYAFMVTNAIGSGSDIQMWCADLVPAAQVPDGVDLAGKDVWALHGHPYGNRFVVDGDSLIEVDSSWVQRYVWQRSDDFRGKLFREAATGPVSAKVFPSDAFSEAVICKNPELNEPFSPSTQTIVDACAYFNQPLSDDARERQEQLVMLYTKETPLYHEMNRALREDNIDHMRYFGAYIKELRDVFKTDHEDQIITPFEGTVWRGIKFPDAEAAIKQYPPGSVFVWPAFTSMSTAKSAAMGFGNLVFEINCTPPPGHYDDDTPEYAPASVEEWSCYKSEHEILFPPNVRFKVEEIKFPDGENGLISPLVVCETVGFDTDGGIVEFSKLAAEENERRMADSDLRERVAQQREELQELRSMLEACCERLEDHGQRLDVCDQRLDGCCQRLVGCEAGAEAGAQGLSELKSKVSSLPAAEDLVALQRELRGCAASRDVTELRDRLEREAAARGTADEARQREEARLRARCDDLEAKVRELAGPASLEQLLAESAQGRTGTETGASHKLQSMLAESLRNQNAMEKEISRISAQVQEQVYNDLRRAHEMDQVMKGLTDKCYMTNMILATEKLKHETSEIKTLLATEPKRAHSSTRRSAAAGNPRMTLDAAVQGVADIKNTLESLRLQFPKDTQAADSAPNSHRQGGDLVAAGGALQAARAARRPTADAIAFAEERC